MLRKRSLLYAALALAVPIQAFAVSGDQPARAIPAPLAVNASLDHCGVADVSVICRVDASWDSVPGATRYTASVSSPDGSVTDLGDVASGGTSFWVAYVGSGTYTVTVSAWGTPPDSDSERVIARESSDAGDEGSDEPKADDAEAASEPAAEDDEPAPATEEPEKDGEQVEADEPCEAEEPPAEDPVAQSAEPTADDETTEPRSAEVEPDAEAETDPAEPDPATCPE